MKSLNLIPSAIIGILFFSNLYLGLITIPDTVYIKYLIFSAIYLLVGFMLISKTKYSELIGFLVPSAILILYPMIMELKNLHPWSSGVLGAFNAIVIICCFILLMLKVKQS